MVINTNQYQTKMVYVHGEKYKKYKNNILYFLFYNKDI